MATSDLIARFIMDALNEANGIAELQRSTLAEQFSCVPSQINYVISTRFSPERGYIVESRRGGGGYIRITRVHAEPQQLIMHTVNAVGEELDSRTASAFVSNLLDADVIDIQMARLILAAVGNNALRPVPVQHRDAVRASIFKHMLVNLISE
jgi:transcriptional regulator CtsR